MKVKLILLSGLDGTGKLFAPFIESLPPKIETQVIAYPTNKTLSYDALVTLVMSELPKEEEFTLLAESFSGYIAYRIALERPRNLKSLIFVATFLENPRPFLSKFLPIVPMKLMLSLPMPCFIAKHFLLGNETLVEELQQTLKEVPSEILYGRLLEIIQLQKATQQLSIKTIYLQATNDKLVPKRVYEVFEKLFSDINKIEIEGSHLILQGNPVESAVMVKKFLC